MQPFKILKSIAAPLEIDNVDTDMIIPKQFLKTIMRKGLGKNLFDEMRYDEKGKEKPDFVLNKPQYRNAQILIAGDNFGCGSSREHAPWALMDFGIRAVISTSFADIFFNNCFQNGLLPIKLSKTEVNELFKAAENKEEITIDLENELIISESGKKYKFTIDAFKKHCLLNGLDDIGLTLQKESEISDFEKKQQTSNPWL